jgi:hypothetical protein
MSTPSNQIYPIIPVLPRGVNVVMGNKLHPSWENYFSQMTIAMQYFLSQQGYTVPQLSDDQISTINDSSASNILSVRTSTGDPIFNMNGSYVKIVTAPL